MQVIIHRLRYHDVSNNYWHHPPFIGCDSLFVVFKVTASESEIVTQNKVVIS